jgi:DNA-binding YbaB/EbfC family protein
VRVQPEIEQLLAQVREQQRRIEEVQRSVTSLAITGYAGNGEVTAKLNGAGRFTEISIDPQLMRRHDAETLGSLVLEAVNDGLRRLTEASRAKFAPIIAEARGQNEQD